jgi:hypothetical protein
MLKDIKLRFLDYIHHLTIYDYFALSMVGVFFLFSFIIFIMIARKRLGLGLFWLMLSLIVVFISPVGIKIYFDKTVKKIELIDKKEYKLNFAKKLVLKGKIKSKAKVDFKKCRVFAKIIKEDKNKYKNILNNLKPKRYLSILLNKELKRGETMPYKIVFDDFKPKYKYKVKVYGECY